jgi:hypothetical protein
VFQILPIDRKYYGQYTCKAANPLGVALHEINLKEARPPSNVLQAKLEVITGK